jgi:hypothetical protein
MAVYSAFDWDVHLRVWNIGVVNVYRRVAVSVEDLSGSSISTARVVVKNTNDNSDARNAVGDFDENLLIFKGTSSSTGFVYPTPVNNYQDKSVYVYDYNYISEKRENIDLRVNAFENTFILKDDTNISQTTQATVDAYTELETLDKLYDRAKSWKMESANIHYPSLSLLPISANGSILDLDSRNLTIDATATSPFAIDKNTHTITIKASILKRGTKFTSITTTGTISTANSATIEFGFIDGGGTQKYLELTGLASADVSVEDNVPATPVSLGSVTNQTGTYKLLFTAPTDASNTVIEVTRTGYTSWTEQFPENDLSMTRAITQYQTTQLAERQIDMLNYAHRILQKEEAINATLNVTTPTVTVTNTITSTSSPTSEANQLAILNVL